MNFAEAFDIVMEHDSYEDGPPIPAGLLAEAEAAYDFFESLVPDEVE